MSLTTTTLELVDGVRIVVPDSLDLITPYVLQEQHDWFEDEIKFVRRLLGPGQQAIDIGANYGVYTLSIAKAVGSTGRVWAFEPASATARLLAEGIAANRFDQVILEQSALSNAGGSARLSLDDNAELNALVHDDAAAGPSETVPVTTLDERLATQGWRDIDFVKIDAEGEEANILEGGGRFFRELSPLVQFEIKAGSDLHLGLAQRFAALGYQPYRLIPGLDLLAPFDPRSEPDTFWLNLFCCKADRAARLADAGLLVPAASGVADPALAKHDRKAYDWRVTLAQLPYAAPLASLWEKTSAAGSSAVVEEALSQYSASQDSSLAPAERLLALQASFDLLRELCARQPSHLRLSSLARAASDYGARSLANNALGQLGNLIMLSNQADVSEPFLAPARRFDSVSPGQNFGNWVLAAVIEQFERLSSFSSFYTGLAARQRLEKIQSLGFPSAEMERRLRMLQRRFGLAAG